MCAVAPEECPHNPHGALGVAWLRSGHSKAIIRLSLVFRDRGLPTLQKTDLQKHFCSQGLGWESEGCLGEVGKGGGLHPCVSLVPCPSWEAGGAWVGWAAEKGPEAPECGERLDHPTSHPFPPSSGGQGARCREEMGAPSLGASEVRAAGGILATWQEQAAPRPVTRHPCSTPDLSLCATLPCPLRGHLPGPWEAVVDPPQGLLQDCRAQLV